MNKQEFKLKVQEMMKQMGYTNVRIYLHRNECKGHVYALNKEKEMVDIYVYEQIHRKRAYVSYIFKNSEEWLDSV